MPVGNGVRASARLSSPGGFTLVPSGLQVVGRMVSAPKRPTRSAPNRGSPHMSTIRAVALMHQHTPGSGPSRPPQTKLMRRAAVVALPFLLTVGVVACGSDSDGAAPVKAEGKTTTTVAKAEETTTTVAEDGSITVTAVDFDYEGLPDTVPAGT